MDTTARNALALEHRGLPYFVVRKLGRRNRAVRALGGEDDAVQVGYLALLHAAERFDPTREVKFVTYAHKVIMHEVYKAARLCSLIHVPAYVQEPIRNDSQSANVRERSRMAEKYIEDGQRALACQLFTDGYEGKIADRDHGDLVEQEDEAALMLAQIEAALPLLSPRERDAVRLRYFHGIAGKDIAARLGVTKQAVSAILRRGEDKIREHVAASPPQPTSR